MRRLTKYVPPRSADKDQSHVIGGLKATITNPNTSADAKDNAMKRLEELGQSDEPTHHELGTHQIAGYKATISSSWDSPYLVSFNLKPDYSPTDPNTSEKAKEHAREVLEAEGEPEVTPAQRAQPTSPEDQHTRRVVAGYKAALHSTSLSFLPRYHPPRLACSCIPDPTSPVDDHVGEEAKEKARKKLAELGEPGF